MPTSCFHFKILQKRRNHATPKFSGKFISISIPRLAIPFPAASPTSASEFPLFMNFVIRCYMSGSEVQPLCEVTPGETSHSSHIPLQIKQDAPGCWKELQAEGPGFWMGLPASLFSQTPSSLTFSTKGHLSLWLLRLEEPNTKSRVADILQF